MLQKLCALCLELQLIQVKCHLISSRVVTAVSQCQTVCGCGYQYALVVDRRNRCVTPSWIWQVEMYQEISYDMLIKPIFGLSTNTYML